MGKPHSLGYAVIETSAVSAAAWRSFGTDALGLMLSDEKMSDSAVMRFRMDERCCRLAVVPSGQERVSFGWEYSSRREMETAVSSLSESGVELNEIGEEDLAIRGVAAAFAFEDPAGASHEVFYGANVDPITQFVSPHGTQFITGDGGFGHGVLLVNAFDEAVAFYEEVLGLQLRDEKPGELAFFGCNSREHSLAIAHAPGLPQTQVMHLMLEASRLEDVGRAQDRALEGAAPLTVTMGQHWNDLMVSCYLKSPSEFEIEFGFGGARVRPDNVSYVRQSGHGGASLWGHRVVLLDGSLGPNLGKAIEIAGT
jgi:3,4-dihydroxy-9,10-secoandrosta-1,3,5(10)-triene-9,17-dione 4,5-dioxygenase